MGLTSFMANRARALRHLYALMVIMAGWVLFPAPETISHALAYLAAMAGMGDKSRHWIQL